jgi:hypothetical protein
MEIEGQTLTDIIIVPSEIDANLYSEVFVCFDKSMILIQVDDSTDELQLKVVSNELFVREFYCEEYKFKDSLVGKKVISFWSCNNHKGYFDCFCLGLDEFIPTIVFTSIASHIIIRLTISS